MIVRLRYLDNLDALNYYDLSDVYLSINKDYVKIGTCKVYANDQGEHFGKLRLQQKIDLDLFMYYRNKENNENVFWFLGLDLYDHEIDVKPAIQIKEAIVT